MPFPFVLPTTSAFPFSSSFSCDSHPSLPLNASTHRGVVKNILKQFKRLPPSSQASTIPLIISNIEEYLPYLLAIDDGLSNKSLPGGDVVSVVLKSTPSLEWRPTISAELVPGRERLRIKVTSLEYEISFMISTMGYANVLFARSALQPLYATRSKFLEGQKRTNAITLATKHILEAASLFDYLSKRAEHISVSPPCADVAPSTIRAMSCLCLAEATLLAVFKDDPYLATVAQDRNKNDKEWMYKAPEIPKVRAHLYARLCLEASEQASKAYSLCHSSGTSTHRINLNLLRYLEDFRRTSRAKACRFFGIDAELGGQTAEGIGWIRAGYQELGVEVKIQETGLSLSRFKKEFTEKREDRRVEKETTWGSDAGKLEETRVLEMLDAKWTKINDTINTQPIPPVNSLLAKMPSGREIYTLKPYEPPSLPRDAFDAMRALPREDDYYGSSSDDEIRGNPNAPGAFPDTSDGYDRSSSTKTYF